VAELADAQDLKSWVPQGACGFDARPRHQNTHDPQGRDWHVAFVAGKRKTRDATDFTNRVVCQSTRFAIPSQA
jgi:hypothetical protein